MNTQINESEMLAYIKATAENYAPLFPELRTSSGPGVMAGTSCDHAQVILHGYINDNYDACYGFGKTYAEAAADLRAKLGTPESKAKELREKAERLLAEAEQLAPTAAE